VGGGHCGRLVRGIDVPRVVGCVWWYPYIPLLAVGGREYGSDGGDLWGTVVEEEKQDVAIS
jgi:hypothetical protein